MARFQLLCLDGGGIRGAFALGLLAELETNTDRPLHECFDLIAGTSTGAITAWGLGAGLSGADLVEFYRRHGAEIFRPRQPYHPKHPLLRPLYPILRRIVKRRTGDGMDHLFRARYCPDALERALTAGFGQRLVGEVRGARVLTPSINLTAGRPHLFGTPHLPLHLPDQALRVVDVLMAATAAPTYFPHRLMPDGDSYVDGGLWAGSPTLLAVAEALRFRQLCSGPTCDPPFDTSEIHVMSIGTGRSDYSVAPPGYDAGALYWSHTIADVMISAQVDGLRIPLRFLLGDRLLALNFDLPDKSWSLDNTDHIEELFALGRASAAEHRQQIEAKFLAHRAVPYETSVPLEQMVLSSPRQGLL